MLLPDFAQLAIKTKDKQSSIFKRHRQNALRHRMTTTAWTWSQFPDNDPFYEFFKRLVPNMPGHAARRYRKRRFEFRFGFIVSKDGYILTNTPRGCRHGQYQSPAQRQTRIHGQTGQLRCPIRRCPLKNRAARRLAGCQNRQSERF